MRNKNIGMQNSTGRICWTIVGLWVMILMRITFADVGNETRTNDHCRLDARYQYHPLLEHCRDKGEAYAASFLVRKDFFLLSMERLILNREPVLGKPPSYSYDGEAWIKRRRELLKKSNIESATFSMMTHVTDQLLKESGREYDGGRIYQSIDVLDFSVLHLSTYERLLHRYSENLRVREGIEDYSAIEQATEVFKVKGLQRQRMEPVYKEGVIPSTLNHFQRTVVVMPYLGHEQGEGNSKIMYRQRYLAACFWSYYAYYPHIVVVVSSVIDRDYILKQSGLPFFDVIYVPELPSPSSLPFAAVMAAARRMSTSTPKQPDQDDVSSSSPSSPSSSSSSSSSLGAKKLKKTMWRTQFDFIFYTESDQMLVARSEDRLSEFYKAIKRDPSRRWDQDFMLSPHRLTVYPKVVLQHIYKFPATEIQQLPFIPVQGKPGEVLLMGDPSEKGTATTMPRRDLQSSMVKPQVVAQSDVDYHVDWQCCQQPSQMCRRPRDHWAVLTSNAEKRRQHPYPTAPALVSLFHPQLYIALGNVDFHYERFHGCTLTGFINRDRQQDLHCPNV